jgi:uncharacterized protein (DUF4415 family)
MRMTKKSKTENEPWIDPDDAPLWTEQHFRDAAYYQDGKLVKPATGTVARAGRPKSDNPKQQVTLRLDASVVEGFRATGPGWQGRINAQLRKALGL